MAYKLLMRVLATLLLAAALPVHAQERKLAFSADTAKFLGQLEAFMRNVGDNDVAKTREAYSTFAYQWTSGLLNPKQKKQAHSVCVLMNEKKLDVSPYFTEYLVALTSLVKKNTDAKTYDVFHKSNLFCLNGKNPGRDLLQYITQLSLLMNDFALMKSPTDAWYVRNAAYQITFDTVPVFAFSSASLAGLVRGDSACIGGTKGKFYPLSRRWLGKGGIVTWQRAGYKAEVVYAKLSDYSIDTRSVSYTADSVMFYHGGYFKKMLPGRLEEKAMADVTAESAIFPKFSMYKGSKVYINLFKDIEFFGKFGMSGSRVTGGPLDEGYCLIEVKHKQKPFINFRSSEVIIRPDRFVSAKTAAVIYIGDDSIYHPSLQVRYNMSDNEMAMIRSDEGLSLSPFFDTYHKLDITCEAIYWKMDSDSIQFENQRGIRTKSMGLFRSADYFSLFEYDKLQGYDEVNPAVLVSAYVRGRNTAVFYSEDFAEWAKKPFEQMKVQLIKLANAGFLLYDLQRDQVKILPRLNEYLAEKSGVKDSDIIQFESTVENKPNASLNLINKQLTIDGVEKVILSDSQYVYVQPRNLRVIVGPNRNFSFNGTVHAGLFDFNSHDCVFQYDKFMLNMPVIDSASMRIASWSPDANGNYTLVRVKNVLANINGDLMIDAPDSKSGRKMLHNYPILISKDTSYIYFERKDIAGGAYKRDRFYFSVAPFSLDSINSLPTGDLRFRGTLVSAGIFPDLPQTVKVQNDYSLGFSTVLASPGLPMYGGKGSFQDTLRLSNRGLRGTGKLSYLSSLTHSDDFLFLPDKTSAKIKDFRLAKVYGANDFPETSATEADVSWLPGDETMTLKNAHDGTFDLFEKKAKLKGSLIVTPKGMKGKGEVAFDNALVNSNSFTFHSEAFTSDTADFQLRTEDSHDIALKVSSFSTSIDFAGRQGYFKATGKDAEMEFPLIKYKCLVSESNWQMDKKQVVLSNKTSFSRDEYYRMTPEDLLAFDPGNEVYTSTDPKQSALRFFAMNAVYDLSENNLEVEDARILKIADAAVFPSDGKLTVARDGKIAELKSATILANRNTLLHKFFNATVKVVSGTRYTASGLYDYTPADGEVTTLEMKNIAVDNNGHTIASTPISDSMNFMLNRYFAFQGKMNINAGDSTIFFEGGYKLIHDCQAFAQEWIKLSAGINPRKVMIPVSDDEENTGNGNLRVSLYYSVTENTILPGFFAKAENVTDPDILRAKGKMVFDRIRDQYSVADMSKLENLQSNGNILSLNTRRCALTGSGTMQLATKLGRLNMNSSGSIAYYSLADSTSVNAMSMLDFFFAKDALQVMADAMNASDVKGIDLNSESYITKLGEFTGRSEADRLMAELGLYGQFRKFPEALDHTLVLADVNYSWNREMRSFISKGPIGVGNAGQQLINKYMNGYIEIGKRRAGDVINIYLEPEENQWYYFSYSNGTLQALSSNKDFNDKLVGLKEKERVIKGGHGMPSYQFIIGTPDKKSVFLRKMKQAAGEL